jgi:hypothetical protein
MRRRKQMGMTTEIQIEAWQKKCGIEPATGGRLDAWRRLQDVCFEAIKIAELEKSGIRDGDGYWHGGDVVGHLCSDLREAVDRLMGPVQSDSIDIDDKGVPFPF